MPQDKPPAVSLNLDNLEREGGEREPFVVVLDGKPMTFTDPGDIDWQDLMKVLRDPRALFEHALSPEDAKRFLEKKLPSWKLQQLMGQYQKHYGIPSPGEASALLPS